MNRKVWCLLIAFFLIAGCATNKQDEGIFAVGSVYPPVPGLSFLSGEVATDPVVPADHLGRSSRSHRSGKHYFEIVLDETLKGQTDLNLVARISDGATWKGVGHRFEERDLVMKLGENDSVRIVGGNLGSLRIPKIVIGLAIDMDDKYLYLHRNGNWLKGAIPGSREGVRVEINEGIVAEVTSSAPLGQLTSSGALRINFGEDSFSGYQPSGYRGFDWPDHLANLPTERPLTASYSLDDKIAGASRKQLVRRYAEWIRSFPMKTSPANDPTGAQCGKGQSGPVWFLAGTRDLSKVERECAIPEGKSILVPILYTVAQTPNNMPCEQINTAVRNFTDGASGLRFSLNGIAWHDMEQHHLSSSCFSLRDGSTGQVTSAVTSGYWIFLPPLPRGRHVIEFGGRFRAEGFDQDVTYVLHVQ